MLTALQVNTADTLTRDGAAYESITDARAMIAQRPDHLAMVQTAWAFLGRLDAFLTEVHGEDRPTLEKLRQLDRGVIQTNIKALTQAALERYDFEMQRPIREILPEAQRHAQRLLSMLNERDRFGAQAHQTTGLQAKPVVTKKLIDTLTALVAQTF